MSNPFYHDPTYLPDATQEYARQHARRDTEEDGECGCSGGWRLTPFDAWVACPGCPQGPHPEDYEAHFSEEELQELSDAIDANKG